MLRRFWWLDAFLMLTPGPLLVLFGLQVAANDDEWSWLLTLALAGYLLFVGWYVVARFAVAPGGRAVRLLMLLPPTVIAFVISGLSLAAGYYVFTFVAMPLLGPTMSLIAMRRSLMYRPSPPIEA